jgi:hypothetical protein
MSEKSLRNWLDRGQIDLPSPPVGKKQRRLTVLDTIFLAAVSTAVNFGSDVRYASEVMSITLSPIFNEIASKPAAGFEALEIFFGWYIAFAKNGDSTTPIFTRDLHDKRLQRMSGFAVISISNILNECGDRFLSFAKSESAFSEDMTWDMLSP